MSRYKGRKGYKAIERDYPHIVEMHLPDGGFGNGINDMQAWHTQRGLQSQQGRGRREDGRFFIHWCFVQPQDAEDFAAQFGGTKL